MPMGTEKNKTKQCPQKKQGHEHHTPPRRRTDERYFRYGQTSRGCQAIQNNSPLDSVCSGRVFLLLRLHVSTSNGILDAAKFHICSVVNTDVADCLLVTILPCQPRWLGKKYYPHASAAFSFASEVGPLLCRRLSARLAQTIGIKIGGNEPMRETMGEMLGQLRISSQPGIYPRTLFVRLWVGIFLGNSRVTLGTPDRSSAKPCEVRLPSVLRCNPTLPTKSRNPPLSKPMSSQYRHALPHFLKSAVSGVLVTEIRRAT
jgi:hypothetical protein